MFESDQHEFDEEYAEISHPAPPLPPKAPAAAPAAAGAPPAAPVARATAAAPVAVQEPIVEEPQEEQENISEEEEPQEEYVDSAERHVVAPPPKKKPNFLLMGGFAALVVFGIFVAYTATRSKTEGPPPGDLGPGIVAVAGLRGHLTTRWEGDAKTGKLVYQLRIEPMEDRWGAGFSRVTSNPPMPISMNIRLLDASGFALCGKEIDLKFNPQTAGAPVSVPLVGANGKKLSAAERNAALQAARQSEIAQLQAAEVIRERNKDVFQNQTTDDGQVTAINVQGALPCAPDQYKRANYWDFNTNFPTLDEQATLLDPKAAQRAKELESPHSQKRAQTKPQDGFVIQGDDRVSGYDSVRGLLWAEQKTFQIDRRTGQATASAWANNYTLIHYRCDQHANCALTAAGQVAVLHARLSE